MILRRGLVILLCVMWYGTASSAQKRSDKRRRNSGQVHFRVGAIFETDEQPQEIAFKKSIEVANELLAKDPELYNKKLTPAIANIDTGDSFAANKEVCRMLEGSVIAIIGPTSPLVSSHVQTICHKFHIPHFEMQWGYRKSSSIYSFNLHPYYKSFGKAILQYIGKVANTDGLGIIYYDDEGLLKFEELLNTLNVRVSIRKFRLDAQFIKSLKESFTHRFIVDIPTNYVKDFMIAASTYNMTTNLYSYIFTSWDVTMVNLEAFMLTASANITTFMITPYISNDEKYAPNFEAVRREIYSSSSSIVQYRDPIRLIPTKAALIYDGVQLLAHALISLSKATAFKVTTLSCSSRATWNHGLSLLNYMNTIPPPKINGLTGMIYFDSGGQRSNFSMDIYEADAKKTYVKFGNWQTTKGLTVTKNYTETMKQTQENLRTHTLRVTTISESPFVIVKERDKNGNPLPDPSAWEGFCIELIKEIAALAKFNYTIHLVRDDNYGKVNETLPDGRQIWNGMIGELMTGIADLALASLTITYEREKVIDFTTPYMNLGLTILFSKPKASNPHLFSFLSPLSPPVWGYVVAAYVLVSGILFVVARFSPYEWFNPHPCNADSDVVENQFNVANSFWFTIASFLQQGSEHAPKSMSTRMVAGIWWFFGLIVISSYTANLAAFLTVERMKSPIESVEDLAKQTRIKYGTLRGGSSESFFARTDFPVYKTMFQFMMNNDYTFTKSTAQGISRVHRGDYAFILESTMNEYYRARNCSLIQIGDKLDSKGYGIGLPRGSVYRDIISEAILQLQNNQVIDRLKRKYWYKYKIKQPCTESKQSSANALRVEQVGGVFVVLLVGMLMAIMCSICEFLYKTRKNASKTNSQHAICTELGKELRFAMRCMTSSKKPVNKSNDDGIGRGATGDSSSRMRMLMEPPPSMLRDDRGSGRWYPNEERYGVNGTQLDHTPRYSPKYPVVGNMSPYPPSADYSFSDSRFKKVPC